MGDRGKNMWEELRRRRVVSSAAAYLAIAFVVLQLAEILFPAFGLGAGTLRALFALLLASFPIAIALSWIYDVTSSGLTRTDDSPGRAGPHPVLLVGVMASACALAGAGWWAVRSVDSDGLGAAAARESSIAVLPFADMSEGGDQAHLGDGMAEEILNMLAGVDGLLVAARTSSFAFRENDDIRDIGMRLDVAYILEGSVRRAGEAVRVTAQLIDTSTGFHVWSQTYDREVIDLFTVQDEIAGAIAEALVGQLDLGPASQRYAASPQAQDLYYRGRAQWNRRDAVGMPEAIELFNRAIEADSLYAEAYAGLADSWALMPQLVSSVDGVDAMERAESHALRALALNDQLAEAHASLGLIRALRQDRVGALGALSRAIDLNPSYAPALHWRANVLAEMGRLSDALVDAERAAAIDPLSAAIASDYGYILLWSGDRERAASQFSRARALDFGFAPAIMGAVLVALQHEQEVALQMALTEWAAVSSLPVSLAGPLATGMLAHRRTGAGQPVPPALDDLARSGRVPAGTTAALHALLGSHDGALSWLRAAIADRSWIDQYLRVNWAYDGLRSRPAFQEILTEVGA